MTKEYKIRLALDKRDERVKEIDKEYDKKFDAASSLRELLEANAWRVQELNIADRDFIDEIMEV